MYLKKTLSTFIFILAIAVLTQLAIAKQPEYLEEEEHPRRSQESMLRKKMEEVREEIDKLNEKLKANIEHLHELEKELSRMPVEKRIRELEESIMDAKAKVEHLKEIHAPEEKIEQLVRKIEEWKRELEELHRPEPKFPHPERRVIVIHLEHAPADYLAEIIEDFLTPDGVVRADMRTNSLIIRDVEPDLRDIEMIIHELDRPESPYYTEVEFMIPEHGREIANIIEITEDSIFVDFPEHWEWPELELWIPLQKRNDGEWARDEEIAQKVGQLGIDAPIEVEWEKHEDDDRLWIVDIEPLGLKISTEEIQEMMKYAMEAPSPEEALARFENVLKSDPECRTIYGKGAQIMVGVNLMKLGKLEEAEDAIKIGLALLPEEDLSLWKLNGYEALGHVYHERDNLEKAIDAYQKAIVLYNLDELGEREVDLHQIIVHRKKVRMKLAQIYIQTDQKELAIDVLQSAIAEGELPKLDAHAHLMLGELHMKSGDLESAKAEFQKILDSTERPETEINEEDIEKAKENLEEIEGSE